MRILLVLISIHLLQGCVGPAPPPAPAYAPQVIDAARVSFRAPIGPAEVGPAVERAARDLGWAPIASRVGIDEPAFAIGDDLVIFRFEPDAGGSTVFLVARSRFATEVLESRAGVLARTLMEQRP